MKNMDFNKEYGLEPMIEVIPFSRIKEKDVIVLRCEKGEENLAISKIHSELRALIDEKDLKILAVTPDFDAQKISIGIELAKNWD
jgi:hypothetical protein